MKKRDAHGSEHRRRDGGSPPATGRRPRRRRRRPNTATSRARAPAVAGWGSRQFRRAPRVTGSRPSAASAGARRAGGTPASADHQAPCAGVPEVPAVQGVVKARVARDHGGQVAPARRLGERRAGTCASSPRATPAPRDEARGSAPASIARQARSVSSPPKSEGLVEAAEALEQRARIGDVAGLEPAARRGDRRSLRASPCRSWRSSGSGAVRPWRKSPAPPGDGHAGRRASRESARQSSSVKATSGASAARQPRLRSRSGRPRPEP